MSGILVVVEVVVTSNSCQLLVAFSRVNCFLIEVTEQSNDKTAVKSNVLFQISFSSALLCCAPVRSSRHATVKRCQGFRERRKITRNFSGEMCEKISRGLTDVDHAFQNCHNLTFRKIHSSSKPQSDFKTWV